MRIVFHLLVIILFAACMTGCATTPGFLADRRHDAADIFTATVGMGAGAKARVGPFRAGIFMNCDKAGLRGGDLNLGMSLPAIAEDSMALPLPVDVDFLLFSAEQFITTGPLVRYRNKHFGAVGVLGLSGADPNYCVCPSYYTQLEMALGLGITFRVGFNPGELLDFILGWFGIDIYGDDIEEKIVDERQREAKQE